MLPTHQETAEQRAIRKSNPMLYFPLFSKTYLKVKTKDGDLVPFSFMDPTTKAGQHGEAQRRVWSDIESQEDEGLPVRIIVLKARQMGLSTFAEAYTFFQVVTHRYRRALVIAHDLDASEGLFEMSKLFYDCLPEEIRPMRRYLNRKELLFENPDEKARILNPGLRSQFEVQTSNNVKAGRSGTLQHLHASEVSFWQNPEDLTSAMFPAIPSNAGTSIIFESTAHGAGNWFHSFWKSAEKKKSQYISRFLPWFIMPEYRAPVKKRLVLDEDERSLRKRFKLDDEQLQWRRLKIVEFEAETAGMGGDMFHQEYPATADEAFLAAGLPALDHKGIERCSESARSGVRFFVLKGVPKESPNGSFEVWEKPRDGEQYTIGVDVSGGLEHGDLSTVEVLRNRGRVQVGEWAGYVDPISFAPIIHNIALWYNEGLVAIEVNNQGIATQRALIDDYWNIYQWKYLDCPSVETSVLQSDLTWKLAGNVKVGDELFSCDEYARPGNRSPQYRRGIVEAVWQHDLLCVRIETDRASVVVSDRHPVLTKRYRPRESTVMWRWVEAGRLREGDEIAYIADPWKVRDDWQGGWLSGVLESEGCLSLNGGRRNLLTVAQNSGLMLDRIIDALTTYGVPGVTVAKGGRCRAVNISKFSKVLRIMGEVRPRRLVEKCPYWWEGISIKAREGNAVVKRVVPVGIRPCAGIQTSTRTLVTDGLLSHNSVTNRASMKLGWVTTISTKPMMLSFTNHCLQHNLCVINSTDLKGEMLSYIRKGVDIAYAGAAPGCMDDRVMAFMIAITVQHIEEHGMSFGPQAGKRARSQKYRPWDASEDEQGHVVTRFVGPPLPVAGPRDYSDMDWRLK